MDKLNSLTTASTMQINDFYKKLFYNFIENLFVIIAGLIIAAALWAIICGDGDKGLADLL